MKFAYIALGGGLGAVLRFVVTSSVDRWTGSDFPFGTLAVNLIGCLSIGLLADALTGAEGIREEWRFLLLVGVLGGFTTFSTFAYESVVLWNYGQWGRALLNLTASNGLGLLGIWAGTRLAVILRLA
jgi:CrcB protein